MALQFASQVTEAITVHGEAFLIRRLSAKSLNAAAVEQQRLWHESLAAMGGAAYLRTIREAQRATAEIDDQKTASSAAPAPPKTPDPLAGFDPSTLCLKGIVEWPYRRDDGSVPPIDAEHIDQMDAETVDAVARAVLKLTKPSLFLTTDEAEAARVKG